MSALQKRREAATGDRKRSVRECIGEIETGADALSREAHMWQVFWPTPKTLNGAQASLDAMLKVVMELRQRIAEG